MKQIDAIKKDIWEALGDYNRANKNYLEKTTTLIARYLRVFYSWNFFFFNQIAYFSCSLVSCSCRLREGWHVLSIFRLLDWMCSHCKRTAPRFKWNSAKTTSPLQFGLGGFYSCAPSVLRPAPSGKTHWMCRTVSDCWSCETSKVLW